MNSCGCFIESDRAMKLLIFRFSEPEKAVKLFLEASNGVRHDVFINNTLLQFDASENMDLNQRKVLYYLKVRNAL